MEQTQLRDGFNVAVAGCLGVPKEGLLPVGPGFVFAVAAVVRTEAVLTQRSSICHCLVICKKINQ